jgi:hypothetical protein
MLGDALGDKVRHCVGVHGDVAEGGGGLVVGQHGAVVKLGKRHGRIAFPAPSW